MGALLLLLLAGPPRASLDTALLSEGEAGPECELQSTEPLTADGASLVPQGDAQLRQVFSCQEDIAVVDLFDMGDNIDRGVSDLERTRWGGTKPPKQMHDALLRKGPILADIFASRATTVLIQAKLQAIGFKSLANGKPVDYAALLEKEMQAKAKRAASGGPRSAATAPATASGGVRWMSYDAGLEEAAASHKPVCLIFTATWCPHCRNYEHVLQDPRVVAKSASFVMIKLDDDHAGSLSNKYAPDGHYVPRTLFLSSQGELDPELGADRARDRYVYSESDPSSILGAMDRALVKLKP